MPRPMMNGMADHSRSFLLFNLALAFYLTGAIWAHEMDIFRNWRVLDPDNFRRVQDAHWKRLPYWVFFPLACALIGAILLVWYHPPDSPMWLVRGSLGCQLASLILTAIFWGPWQAKLSRDPAGAESAYLARILRTHWIRTLLINGYAACLLILALEILGG